jgi:hypothetical protein
MILRPTVRVNEFGVKAFPPDLTTVVAGHTVTVRDWYGENVLACSGVTIGHGGYPSALQYTRPDGRTGEFSLFSTREIEVGA